MALEVTEMAMVLSVRQTARTLDSGQSTVRRWIARGELPVVRLGRRVMVRKESLAEFIAAREQRLGRTRCDVDAAEAS
jgi:excisionase family DNA binding protein